MERDSSLRKISLSLSSSHLGTGLVASWSSSVVVVVVVVAVQASR